MVLRKLVLCLSVLMLMVTIVSAQDSAEVKESGEMPEMGPPEQMNEIAFLVGDWVASGKLQMDPESGEWSEWTGSCTYALKCGGAFVEGIFKMEMMGMPFEGYSMQSFDRENDQWQMSWTDNMGCRQSYYSGYRKDGKTVILGEEKYQGNVSLSRITTFNETETSFDWTMESSTDGGKSWNLTMDAAYTKK